MTTSTHPADRAKVPSADLAPPPMARVRRIQLLRREIREFLSPSALEVLFAQADTVVEGGTENAPTEQRVYATVMITLDLERCSVYFREPVDEATAERVAELLQQRELPASCRELARRELASRVAAPAGAVKPLLEHHARAEGRKVLLDIDAMAVIHHGATQGR